MLALTAPAGAHDLGTQGKTFPIIEPNLEQVMMSRASRVDWRRTDQSMARQARHQLHHMTYAPLPATPRTRVQYYVPDVVLSHNIKAPVWTHGHYAWKVVARKGERVNPLAQGLRPVTRMLFFDPRSKAQLRFALAVQRAFPVLVQLVSTGGDVAGMAKQLHFPIYYAYPFIVKGFHVERTPTLVGIGAGPYVNAVSLAQFGPGVLAHLTNAVSVARAAWYGGTVQSIRAAAGVAANAR